MSSGLVYACLLIGALRYRSLRLRRKRRLLVRGLEMSCQVARLSVIKRRNPAMSLSSKVQTAVLLFCPLLRAGVASIGPMTIRCWGGWRWSAAGCGWMALVSAMGAMSLPVVPAPREATALAGDFSPTAGTVVTWRGPAGATRADFAGPLQAELTRWHEAAAAPAGGEAAVAFGLP